MHEWNDSAALSAGSAGSAAPTTLPQLFAQHAARTPLAPACADAHVRLTYGELDRRSDRLAHRLRALGVGPEAIVAIAMERSAAMVTVLLGVLKAGAAYLPLDPAYPAARLAFMLATTAAAAWCWRRRRPLRAAPPPAPACWRRARRRGDADEARRISHP